VPTIQNAHNKEVVHKHIYIPLLMLSLTYMVNAAIMTIKMPRLLLLTNFIFMQ